MRYTNRRKLTLNLRAKVCGEHSDAGEDEYELQGRAYGPAVTEQVQQRHEDKEEEDDFKHSQTEFN